MNGMDFTRNNEGCRLQAYKDTRGFWTIGYGRKEGVAPGSSCTQDQADEWFEYDDYPLALWAAKKDFGPGWDALDDVRKAAFIDLAYEMGGAGLAGFQKMLTAARAGDWAVAHDELLDSEYALQVPNRAHKVATMLALGAWPEKS